MISLSQSVMLTLIAGSSSGFFFFRFLPRDFFPVSTSIRDRSSSFFFCSSRRAWRFSCLSRSFFRAASRLSLRDRRPRFYRRMSAEDLGRPPGPRPPGRGLQSPGQSWHSRFRLRKEPNWLSSSFHRRSRRSDRRVRPPGPFSTRA